MPRIAVFDPFSGASGDMILGALVDAGVSLTTIRDAVIRLGIEGVRITSQPAASGAIRGTRVVVEPTGEQPSRDWRTIRVLLEKSALTPPVRDAALAVFSALASVEAEAHGEPIEDVHFHEVGAVDAIVDIVGACAGLDALGVEQIASRPVAVGSGWVRSDHGLLPVPAPATAILLAKHGVPIRPDPPGVPQAGELLTPTGAAILGALATWYVPPYVPDRLGYGFGTRELPWPNALRLWIGETSHSGAADGEELLAGDEHRRHESAVLRTLERASLRGGCTRCLAHTRHDEEGTTRNSRLRYRPLGPPRRGRTRLLCGKHDHRRACDARQPDSRSAAIRDRNDPLG